MKSTTKNGIRRLPPTRSFSGQTNLNITEPSKGRSIRQNIVFSLARVKRAPDAGGSGTIKP